MFTPSKLKIFLAHPSASHLESCKHHLHNMGYAAVFPFPSTQACLKRLPLKPDIVFLDTRPGSPEEVDLLRKVRAFNSRIRVAYLDGNTETAIQATLRRAERHRMLCRKKEAMVQQLQSVWGKVAKLFTAA